MRVEHNGFEVTVTREKSLGGDDNIYTSIFRILDGLEVVCSFEPWAKDNTVRDAMNYRLECLNNGEYDELIAELEEYHVEQVLKLQKRKQEEQQKGMNNER